MKDKKLVLKDGTVFEGISYAADKDFIGCICWGIFNFT